MSLSDRKVSNAHDVLYKELILLKSRAEVAVQAWMDNATTLHSTVSDADEKTEIIALRTEFVASLRTILGV